MDKYNIIFFGTPQFALPTLKALHQEGFNIVLVVTRPDKPSGRRLLLKPSPVKSLAQELNLPICDSLKELRSKINNLKPQFGVVVAYGKIIPQDILDSFPFGLINVHPSLLPKYRGPSPIQAALLNGDQDTGITIMKLDEEMDHGDILSQKEVPISPIDNSETLHDKLADLGAKLLVQVLPEFLTGKIIPQPQDHAQATLCKIIRKDDGLIDWSKSAEEIDRQIRAFSPWPGSFSDFMIKNKKTRLKILKARLAENSWLAEGSTSTVKEPVKNQIGKFQQKNGHLYVQCGQGSLIIEELQPEGKKTMSAQEFINGYF